MQTQMKPQFIRPLVITIILVGVYRLGIFVPIPFLTTAWGEQVFSLANVYSQMDVQFSIFMLGIMPYVSAYLLVEISSLCIPFLRKMRSGDAEGRKKLKWIAWVLALAFAVFQAKNLVSGLKSFILENGESVLILSNTFEHIALVCVIVGGFCLLVALCELITRFGVGHGISIVLLSGICADFIGRVPMYLERFNEHAVFAYLIVFFVFSCLISVAYILLKTKITVPCHHEKDITMVDFFQLNFAPSSIAALGYASSILMLPATLSMLFGFESTLVNKLHPGAIGYNLISTALIIMFSLLLGWAFLHPRKRVQKMQAWGWRIAEMNTTAAADFILKRQFVCNLPWTLFLCIMAVVPSLIMTIGNAPIFLNGGSITIMVAICLDLGGGFQFYQHNLHQPRKIAEFHDIYDANMIQNHLKAVGIKSFLQGYHHRLLSYFFSPHIEMSLIIDDQDEKRVQALIQDYYGGLGLYSTIAKSNNRDR